MTINLLLGNIASTDSLSPAGRLISLSPIVHKDTYSPELVDGEQAYALYELTEKADNLAMDWARAVYATLTSWPLFTYRGIDLQPLVINRLFRAFFLDRARIYLGVRRILKAEAPQNVTIYSTDKVDALFAQAACLDVGVQSTRFRSPGATRRKFRVPTAFRIFISAIAIPALRHGLSRLYSPVDDTKVPHIVFLERGGVGSQMIVGAFDTLRAERDVLTTIVRFGSEPSSQDCSGARYINCDDYQNLETLFHLLAYQARVMAWRSTPIDWPNSVLSLVASNVIRFLKQVALPSIVHTLELIHRLIRVERPALLAVTDETGLLGKAVAMQGRKWGVPTLNVQHGVRADSPWIEDQLFDRFAVFGPSTSEVFVERGNDPAIFVPTGVPRYDRLFRRQGIKSRQQVAADLGLDSNRQVVTFASQRAWGRMTPAVKRETLLALFRACRRTDVQLVLKLRHGQSDYVPVEATREPGWEHVKVIAEYDLYDLLNASDVVVTAYSTVGMETVALGKPLLIINLTGQPDPIPYVQEGVALGVYQPEQVGQALLRLLNTDHPNPDWMQCRQDFIRRHLTSDDGRSAERVAQLMLEMIER